MTCLAGQLHEISAYRASGADYRDETWPVQLHRIKKELRREPVHGEGCRLGDG